MIKKKENCEYCGEKMESITAKKRFCSEKCRVYFSRTKSVLKNEPQKLVIGSNFASKLEKETFIAKTNIEPPFGLKGMDLMIWKSENKNN